jgi:hypothetical protein
VIIEKRKMGVSSMAAPISRMVKVFGIVICLPLIVRLAFIEEGSHNLLFVGAK